MWLKLRDFLYTRTAKLLFVLVSVGLVGGGGSWLLSGPLQSHEPVTVGKEQGTETPAGVVALVTEGSVTQPSDCQEALTLTESVLGRTKMGGTITYVERAQLWVAYEAAKDLCSFTLLEQYTAKRLVPWLHQQRAARSAGSTTIPVSPVSPGTTSTTQPSTTSTTQPPPPGGISGGDA